MFTYVQMHTYGALRKPFGDTELRYQLILDCQNIVALRKVPRLRLPFVLLVAAACRRRRVRNVGGTLVTGEKIKYLGGGNTAQCHNVHHKSHMVRTGIEPWPPR